MATVMQITPTCFADNAKDNHLQGQKKWETNGKENLFPGIDSPKSDADYPFYGTDNPK